MSGFTFTPARLHPMAKFWRKVRHAGESGCLEWQGATSAGYGHIRRDGRAQLVHRYIYEQVIGPIPDGMQIDHLCRNRLCVNIEHLEPVTQAENLRRQGAAVTHCPRGHAYTPENTYLRPGRTSGRVCRTCARERQA